MSRNADSYGAGRGKLHFDSRSTNSIVAGVIAIARAGVKKSDLAKRSGLSYDLLERYTNFLKEQGFVEERTDFDTFEGRTSIILFATKKGIDFLEKYNSLLGFATDERFASEPFGKYEDNPFRAQERELRF